MAEHTPEMLAMARPRELFDAVGELALAIAPHRLDTDQRAKIRAALIVLVDHIIAIGEGRNMEHFKHG